MGRLLAGLPLQAAWRRRTNRRDAAEYLEREIEETLEARTGRECLFMPSGRFATYLAFRILLSPGARILMSPLEDDTVFFGALAAGLRPVMAPVSIDDGNIQPEAVPDGIWSSIDAVLTTNMYGSPDRVVELSSRSDGLGIPLIEDAAHALETEVDGRPIGAFGAASAFSLSKHYPGRGGALSLGAGISSADVKRVQDQLMTPRPLERRLFDIAGSAARGALDALHLKVSVHRAREMLQSSSPVAWRVPLRASRLKDALSSGSLDGLDPWMGTAYPDYRMPQGIAGLQRTLAGLRRLELDREKRISGVLSLRYLDAMAPGAREGTPQPLLRVPLLIEDRDAVAIELRRRRIRVYFVYDPPLDDYSGPEFAEPSAAPEAARWWAAHVLPVDPHDAEHVLDLLGKKEIQLKPATLPVG